MLTKDEQIWEALDYLDDGAIITVKSRAPFKGFCRNIKGLPKVTRYCFEALADQKWIALDSSQPDLFGSDMIENWRLTPEGQREYKRLRHIRYAAHKASWDELFIRAASPNGADVQEPVGTFHDLIG